MTNDTTSVVDQFCNDDNADAYFVNIFVAPSVSSLFYNILLLIHNWFERKHEGKRMGMSSLLFDLKNTNKVGFFWGGGGCSKYVLVSFKLTYK